MSVLHWIGNPWGVPVGLALMRGGRIGVIFVPKESCAEPVARDQPDRLSHLLVHVLVIESFPPGIGEFDKHEIRSSTPRRPARVS